MSKICFVSEECVGVAEAGGIGACVRGLSQSLADSGHEVDVLITDLSQNLEYVDLSPAFFARRVLFLRSVSAQGGGVNPPGDSPSKSYGVYLYLKERDYDEVHFHDFLGLGFYAAMARRMGLLRARVVTHLHGSSRWVRQYNLNPPDIGELEQEALERSQIENSDQVISPSRYLLEWCRADGVKLPASIQRNWVLPQWAQQHAVEPEFLRTRPIQGGQIDEIIFFGRHERRKGFKLFVAAIAALPAGLQPDVTFIGRFDQIAGEHSGAYALRKLQDYPGRIRFLSDFKQSEALRLLKRSKSAVAIIPSLIENSPCVIGECFTIGVPFLATDVGGVAELISEASRANCLTSPNAAELSAAIVRALKDGMPELVSTLNPTAIKESWTTTTDTPVRVGSNGRPLVSVCLTHHERPHLLRRAIDALLEQTYDHIEIIVVDDGSRSAGAIAYLAALERATLRFPISVIRTPNRYLGAARNSAAKAARGEFLLFHDDDNYAETREVEIFVQAALSYNADILTCLFYTFREGEQDLDGPKRLTEFYPFGIGGEFSFFMNRFGDANALIRRSVFEEIGGFTEKFGVCFEDWEFFLKAHLAGKRMGIVPEPLFNYRTNPSGMLAHGDALQDYERIYDLIDQLRPSVGADLIRVAYRQQLAQLSVGRTLQVLAPQRGGDIMQQLTHLEPNSRDAVVMLSELAIKFGRFTDAVELASRDRESRMNLEAVMRDPAVVRRLRGSFEMVVLEPNVARDFVFVSGWAMDGEGVPLDLPAVWIDGLWWRVTAIRRGRRPDVARAFGLFSELDLGFRIYAAPVQDRPPQALPVFAPGAGSSLDPGLDNVAPADAESWRPMVHPFRLSQFEANLPDGPGWRGHIEKGEWQRRANITLPKSLEAAPIVEIETSLPSDPIVIWADGVIDWGKRVTQNRVRFSRDEPGAAPEFTVIAPSHVRTHVTAS